MTVLRPGDTQGTKERGPHPQGASMLIEETDSKQMIIENISKYDCGCGGCYLRKVQDTLPNLRLRLKVTMYEELSQFIHSLNK